MGYSDAYQEAFIALADAKAHWRPERGPFQAIVRYYLRGHFANLIDKDDRRRGVPVHMRKSGRQRIKNGHVYELTPADEVVVRTVSANQVGPDGEVVDVFELLPDESTAESRARSSSTRSAPGSSR